MAKDELDPLLFNIELLVLNKQHLNMLQEVTKLNIFEANSRNFDPDGLFSTDIFGQVGSDSRNTNMAYVDLKVKIMHPIVYKNITKLKAFYKDILSGKKYAVFDTEINDFILSDQEEGNTGYSFFMKHMKDIDFGETDSDQRKFRVDIVKKYSKQDDLLDKLLVLPAGLRDYVVSEDGKPSEDEVNDLYRKLIRATDLLKNTKISSSEESVLDPVRFSIQNIVLDIYEHFRKLLDGKNKFIQGSWAKRGVSYGSRNVLTPNPVYVKDLKSDKSISFNDTVVGLYQYVKSMAPITIYKLHTKFINKIFDQDTLTARLFDPKSLKSTNVEVKQSSRDQWMSTEGIEKIMSKLSQEVVRTEPIMIDGYYMLLVYDNGSEVKVIFSNDDITDDMNEKFIKPINYAELFYLAVYDIVDKFPVFVTRYPVASLGGIYPSNVYLKTTVKGRKTKVKIGYVEEEVNEYPKNKERYVNSISVHPTKLDRLGADFDGDRD